MNETLEHIRQELKSLTPAERFGLWKELGGEFEESFSADEDEGEIESEWDAEIESRVKEVINGTVELVPSDEFEQEVDSLFAELGLKRRQPE